MAYFNTKLIARRGYSGRASGRSGLGGTVDDIIGAVKSAGGSVLDFYGKEKTAEGTAAALTAQNAALTAALAQQRAAASDGGILGLSPTEILLAGGGVLAVVLLTRKK